MDPNASHVASTALKGQHISAQGKAAEAAALGKRHPHPISLFCNLVCPESFRGKPDCKKERKHFVSVTQGVASHLSLCQFALNFVQVVPELALLLPAPFKAANGLTHRGIIHPAGKFSQFP